MILAVAVWKAWRVPILVVLGIIGCVIRGLVDMADNFETGYGLSSRRATRQAFGILVIFVLAAVLLGLFGCSKDRDTVAPAIVRSTQASYSGNQQNSGMLRAPKLSEEGFPVNQDWIDGYDALLAKFGDRLFPPRKTGDRNGVTKKAEGEYQISDAVLERYDNMDAIRRDEEKRKRIQ